MGEEIKQQMVGESQKSQTAPYQSHRVTQTDVSVCVCVFSEVLLKIKDISGILEVKINKIANCNA